MACKNGHPRCGPEMECHACTADDDAKRTTNDHEAADLHTFARGRQNRQQEKYGTRPQGRNRR